MKGGLETTFAVLSQTGNESAVDLLIAALDSSDRDIQTGAVRTLLHRSSLVGKRELVRRWNELSERWKTLVADRPGRMSGAVRDAILSSDARLRTNGCDAVLWTRDYDLVPVLVTAAEDKSNPEAELAAQTLVTLCEMLREDLAAPRRSGRGRDPRCLSVDRPAPGAGGAAFRAASSRRDLGGFSPAGRLRQPGAEGDTAGSAQSGLSGADRHSQSQPTARHHAPAGRFLGRSPCASAVHQVLSHRQDVSFLRLLLKHVGQDPSPGVRANLRRIKSFSWLQGDLTILSAFHDDEQRSVVQLLLASGLNRLDVFAVLKYLLQRGNPRCRQAVVAALADFRGAEANALILQTLADP